MLHPFADVIVPVCIHDLCKHLHPGSPANLRAPDHKIKSGSTFHFCNPVHRLVCFFRSEECIRGNRAREGYCAKERQDERKVGGVPGTTVYRDAGFVLHLFERGGAHTGDEREIVFLLCEKRAKGVRREKRCNSTGHHHVCIEPCSCCLYDFCGCGTGGEEDAHKVP